MWPFFVNPNQRRVRNAARQQFLVWLGARHPNLAARVNPGSGFGAEMAALAADYSLPSANQTTVTAAADDSWWKSLTKSISEAAPQFIQAKAQYDLMKTNLRRAEQGLPPIDSASIAPTVKVQAQTSPEQNKVLLIGAAIIGGALLLPALLKRR